MLSRRRSPIRLVALAVLLASAALVARAQSSDSGARPPRAIHVQALRLPTADGELKFRQRRLAAAAGRVTFVFRNPAVLPHNFAVRTRKGKKLGVTATIANGRVATIVLSPRRGDYVFYCAVPGHEASGMHG